MNKKECERAYADLEVCREVMRESIERNGEIINPVSSFDKAMVMFARLIDEHFDNPPLKFEELEIGMWVWDKQYKRFLNTGNKYVLCEDGKYHFAPFYDDFLCGNLYDFVNTDGFDDDGNEIGYEIILKKRFENRFYRKQVEE